MVGINFNKYLEYRDGTLFWKPRGIKNWDSRNAGNAVGNNMNGYLMFTILGKRFLVHRVVWHMFHGEWPKNQLDHINGVRNDNRIENLRECNNAENNRAVGLKKNNTTGYKGVTFNKPTGKFFAYIRFNYKRIHLGVWDVAEDAAKAYNEAAIKYFGGFANLNRLSNEENWMFDERPDL